MLRRKLKVILYFISADNVHQVK